MRPHESLRQGENAPHIAGGHHGLEEGRAELEEAKDLVLVGSKRQRLGVLRAFKFRVVRVHVTEKSYLES